MSENKNPNAVDPKKIAEETGVELSVTRRLVIKVQHDERFGQGNPLAY